MATPVTTPTLAFGGSGRSLSDRSAKTTLAATATAAPVTATATPSRCICDLSAFNIQFIDSLLSSKRLQRLQKGDQILLFLVAETDPEAVVVEANHLVQVLRRAVVEIRRSRRERTQRRPLEAADVLPAARDEGTARIGRLDRRAGSLVAQRVERHVRRAPTRIGEADVERQWHRVIACVRGVVASRAGAEDGGNVQVVIETLDVTDHDRLAVEERLATGDRAPRDGDAAVAPLGLHSRSILDVRLPAGVQRHDRRREARVATIVADQGVVDAEVRGDRREEGRPAVG